MNKQTPLSYILMSVWLCVLGALPVKATQTEIWTTDTFEELQQGKFEHISLRKNGALTLAPKSELLLALQEHDVLVWALATDSNDNLYVGTGEQGQIFKVTPSGEVSVFFDSPEIGILSVAVDAEDNVYAGSAPDGLIYRVTPDGQATTFFMTHEHYVWSLIFGDDHVLYAGTGESGKVFTILPDGTGTVLYDSPQAHVMSLVFDPQGWLYAGTEGEAVAYRIDLDGQAFALYHAKEEEIHSLALDQSGNLYLAALSSQVYPKTQALGSPNEQPQEPKEKSLKYSTLYRMSPEGALTNLLKLENALIYSMSIAQDGQLWVGTDDDGLIYKIFPDGQYQHVLTLDAETVVALYQTPEGTLYAGTSDMGAVYRISPELFETGQYLSIVHDAKTVAAWGKIFWRGTPQQTTLFTRTGNTSIPDDTWSLWSPGLKNTEGDTIPTPSARFIQWKAVLSAQDSQIPEIDEVSVAYLPLNLAPEVEQIVTYHASQQQQKNNAKRAAEAQPASFHSSKTDVRQSNSPLKAPKYIPPDHIAVVWKASDPNKEPLMYTLALRGAGEQQWKILQEEWKETNYFLDTTSLPDDSYVIKVIASDRPNNPPDMALEGERVSEWFEVDNTPPTVSIALNQEQQDNTVFLTVIAQDDFSRLKHAEYAVDGDEWLLIFPDDLVTDSRDEKYSISLSELEKGNHVLTFKTTDLFDNTGVGRIRFSTSEMQPLSPLVPEPPTTE